MKYRILKRDSTISLKNSLNTSVIINAIFNGITLLKNENRRKEKT